jgi:hypothetical protein
VIVCVSYMKPACSALLSFLSLSVGQGILSYPSPLRTLGRASCSFHFLQDEHSRYCL